MIKLTDKKAQVMLSEYVTIVVVVIASITAMTVYFRRSLQARIHDAHVGMVKEVAARTNGIYNGNIYYEYEPYYVETNVDRSVDSTVIERHHEFGNYERVLDEKVTVQSESEQKAPWEAD